MAEIRFYGNIQSSTPGSDGVLINHTAGSGIGFYGSAGFGSSVPVGTQQSNTYITNSLGVNQGSLLNNTAFTSNTTAKTNQVTDPLDLDKLPNYLCPLNIRFTHTEPVQVQNCKLTIFNRSSIQTPASGVTTRVFEARHPSTLTTISNLSHRARQEDSWFEFSFEDGFQEMDFTASPGASGLNTNSADTSTDLGYTSTEGLLHKSARHDWFVALSSEPETVGSKTAYGLYFSLEYL